MTPPRTRGRVGLGHVVALPGLPLPTWGRSLMIVSSCKRHSAEGRGTFLVGSAGPPVPGASPGGMRRCRPLPRSLTSLNASPLMPFCRKRARRLASALRPRSLRGRTRSGVRVPVWPVTYARRRWSLVCGRAPGPNQGRCGFWLCLTSRSRLTRANPWSGWRPRVWWPRSSAVCAGFCGRRAAVFFSWHLALTPIWWPPLAGAR